MSLYGKLARNPKQFLTLTGMSVGAFEALLPQMEGVYEEIERARKARVVQTGAPRQRQVGGGGQFANEMVDRVLMLLIYYRLYLSQEFLTLLFQAQHKSVICRNIQAMRPVVEAVLPVPERAFQRVLALAQAEQQRRHKRIGTVDEFREVYPELTFLIDGVEQPKRKPNNPEKRKRDYSGKKKQHTRKQVVMATPSGIIVD